MSSRQVIIIMGDENNNLANEQYNLDVHPQCDHTYILTDFMLRNNVLYSGKEYRKFHVMLQMAILSNIVIFSTKSLCIISLPDQLTNYQLEKLKEQKEIIDLNNSLLCIMNIKEEEKIIFEEISTTKSPLIFNDLIEEKNRKWLNNNEKKKVKKISNQ